MDPMRILVIEDERPIADFIQQGLEAEGYAVTCVGNGEEGLARALSGDYSLVLLDVLLPGLGGLEVLERLRAEREDVPVLMLTALGETEDKVKRRSTSAPTTIWRSRSPSRSFSPGSGRSFGSRISEVAPSSGLGS